MKIPGSWVMNNDRSIYGIAWIPCYVSISFSRIMGLAWFNFNSSGMTSVCADVGQNSLRLALTLNWVRVGIPVPVVVRVINNTTTRLFAVLIYFGLFIFVFIHLFPNTFARSFIML